MSFVITHYSQPNKPLESYIAVGGKNSMTTVKALWDPSSPQSLISAETVDLINPLQKSKEKFVSKDIYIEKEFFSVSVSLSDEITFIDVSFMKADLSSFKNKKIGVISNLPYNLTTPIIEKILLEEINLTNFVFMVQKEVSGRIFAKVGTKEYSPLSIMFEYLGKAETIVKVTKDKFIPAPNVDSVILRLSVNRERDFEFEKKFFKFLNE